MVQFSTLEKKIQLQEKKETIMQEIEELLENSDMSVAYLELTLNKIHSILIGFY